MKNKCVVTHMIGLDEDWVEIKINDKVICEEDGYSWPYCERIITHILSVLDCDYELIEIEESENDYE